MLGNNLNFNKQTNDRLHEIRKKLKAVKDELPLGQTIFKDTNFVLNHPTPEENYLQCFKEIRTLFDSIDDAEFRMVEFNIDKDEADFTLKEESNVFEKRRLKLKIDMSEHSIKSNRNLIVDALERINNYYEQAIKLEKEMGEPLKRGEYNKSQSENWTKRLESEINDQIVSSKTGIDAGFIKAAKSINKLIVFDQSGDARLMAPEEFQKLVNSNKEQSGENNG
jgi:hypothetical protein